MPINKELEIVTPFADELTIAAEMRALMAVEMGADWDQNHEGWRERYVEYFANRQRRGESQVFYAKVQDEIIGMASVSILDDYHAYVRHTKSGRINAVYVSPSHRRHGFATALVNACLNWLRTNGCVNARLNSSEQGIQLYESMGFKPRREMELPL
jgi:GNAT superfamily N-acetyltransferase